MSAEPSIPCPLSAPLSATIPVPPNKPEDYECCHRGCCPCIFDYYWNAMSKWEEKVRAMGLDPDQVLGAMGRTR